MSYLKFFVGVILIKKEKIITLTIREYNNFKEDFKKKLLQK